MKNEDKTKLESIKGLKIFRKKQEKSAVNNITKRKQAEEKLKDSEEYLKMLFDYAPGAYYISDIKGNFIGGNKAAERLTGYKREELIGKSFLKLKLLSLADIPKAAKLLVKNLRGKPTGSEEFVLNRKDNSKVTIEISTYPVKIKGKTLVLGIARDVTERKQAEERIKHFNLVLYAIRDINQLIVQEKDRERLLKGVCDSLIKTRGYYHSRIVLLDEEGKIDTYIEAGLGKDFLPLVKLLKKDKIAPCGQIALKQKEVVIIKDPANACPDCPLVQACSARGSVMTVRLEHDGKIYGVMSVSFPAHFITNKEEQELFMEVARDIALGLNSIETKETLHKQTRNLTERVKELNCFFKISMLMEKTNHTLEETIQGIVDLLPASWQYPEITCARIVLGDKIFKTKNCKETLWKQSADLKVNQKTIGVLEVGYLEERPEMDEGPFQKEERDLVKAVTERLGKFIDREKSVIQLQQNYQRTKRAMDATIETMSKIVEAKDPYTAGHQKRVSQLSTAIAKELNLSEDLVEGIRIASLIHDIGKIGLPTEILSKPTKLSDIEFKLIKEHSQIGHDILKSIDFSYPVANIVLQHHERINGSGYPQALKGKDILLGAKIIGIADVVEAMSSHRPYRPALGVDKALEEITQNKDILYDPEVVDACSKLFREKGFKFE